MPENCAAIVIAAKHHELTKVKDTRGTTHTVGALRCKFDFRTNDWLNAAKTAMFCNGDALLHPEVTDGAIAVPLDVDNECAVPYEVLTDTAPYSIGVWGVTDKGLRIVSKWLVFNAQLGCYTEGSAPEEPETTVYEKILMNSQNAIIKVEEVYDRVNSGVLDGASAYELAKNNGFEGTEQEWLDSLKGKDGKDGKDGINGTNGTNGKDGEDGLTPYIKDGYWWIGESTTGVKAQGDDGVSVTHLWNGTTLSVSSASGTSSANLKGEDGKSVIVDSVIESGADGGENKVTFSNGKTLTVKNGNKGNDGKSVTVTSITESTEDGGENKVTFSDETTLTVRNGSKGDAFKYEDFTAEQLKALKPIKDVDYFDGEDGLTPFIAENGNWWIGTTDTGVKAKGTDGISTTHSWSGTTLTVTSASGASSANLKGDDGEDGISCTHAWDGTKLVITSASGISSMDLKGKDGANGQDGDTPIRGEDYWTEADKAEIRSYVDSLLVNYTTIQYVNQQIGEIEPILDEIIAIQENLKLESAEGVEF